MTSSDEIETTTELNAEQLTEAENISYQFFLAGLPNAGKTRFIESIPAIFGDDLIIDSDIKSKFDRLRQLSSQPQMTVARNEYTFTIKQLVRDRYTRTITIHDNAGLKLSTAFEKIDGIPDAEAIKQEQQAEIVSDFTNADAVIYLVGHDALFSKDRKETQEIEFHFQTLSRQLAEQRHGLPPLAILVTKCDLSNDAQSKQAPNTFSESFVDLVEQRIKSHLFTNDSLPKKYRIFPITSFGFSNYKEKDGEKDSSQKVYLPKQKQMHPAGAHAAFTWLAEQIDNTKKKKDYKWMLVALIVGALISAWGASTFFTDELSPCEEQWSEYDTKVKKISTRQHNNTVSEITKSLHELSSHYARVKDLDFATDQGDCSASEFKEEKEDCLAQMESSTKQLRDKLGKELERRLKVIEAKAPSQSNVEAAFKNYALAMEVVDRTERKDFAKQHAPACIRIARNYFHTSADNQNDSTKLVTILSPYTKSPYDPNHDIRDRYNEYLSENERLWQNHWHDGIEDIIKHNSDPVEMYRRLREFTEEKDREARGRTSWDQSLRDQPKQLLAFCEFLVGTKDQEAKQDDGQFKRKLRLMRLNTIALNDNSIELRISLKPESGIAEPSSWHYSRYTGILGPNAKIYQRFNKTNSPTFSFTWKPGESLKLKIRDTHVWGSTLVNHGNLPLAQQPKGQEIMAFHGYERLAPRGGAYTEIELEVDNLIQCPEFFKELVDQTTP